MHDYYNILAVRQSFADGGPKGRQMRVLNYFIKRKLSFWSIPRSKNAQWGEGKNIIIYRWRLKSINFFFLEKCRKSKLFQEFHTSFINLRNLDENIWFEDYKFENQDLEFHKILRCWMKSQRALFLVLKRIWNPPFDIF